MQPKAGVSAALSLSAVLQDERREGKRPQFGTATKRVKSNATPVIIKLVNNNPYKLILLQNLFKIGDLDTYNFFSAICFVLNGYLLKENEVRGYFNSLLGFTKYKKDGHKLNLKF